MKAVLCQRFGTPEDLVLADIPDPVAGQGEVVAKVAAVGLNFFDTLIVAGKYQTKPAFPFSPGGEFAGVVESVGAGVDAFKPGDRVMGYTNFNAARERTAVAADNIVKLPPDLDFDRAAALTITYGTAYHALKHRALMRAGETLAVLGASGGVGLAAVEVGSQMGARVIACASTDDKLAFVRAHGAHELVNYKREDLRAALKRLGGEHGVDVVFDPVGGRYSEPALRFARLGGPPPGRRICRRRDSKTAAQSRTAEELRRPRRVLGIVGAPADKGVQGRHRDARPLVRRGQAVVPRPEDLSARADSGGAQSAGEPGGDGQAGGAGVT